MSHVSWCRVPRSIQAAALSAALLLSLCAAPARAQLAPDPPQTLSGVGASTDLNDLAYDEINDVYLHVFSGGRRVHGRFTNAAGVPIGGPFLISTHIQTMGGWPTVAYSTGSQRGVFLVTYATDINKYDRGQNVYGQLVRFNGSAAELVGGPFAVGSRSTNPAIMQNTGSIAFNPRTEQFLVTWDDFLGGGNRDVHARLFGADGAPASGEVNVSSAPFDQGNAKVAFDWRANRFLVVWQGEAPNSNNIFGTWARVLDGATAQPVGGMLTVSTGGRQDFPNALFLPEANRFLAFWKENDNVVGRLITSDGAFDGLIQPLLATALFDGVPDADYNWATRSVFLVAQHGSNWVWGATLTGSGVPSGASFQASRVAPKFGVNGGSFYPHVISGKNGQFGVSYGLNYETAWFERWKAPVAPTPGPRYGFDPIEPPPVIDLSKEGAPNGSWFLAEGVAERPGSGGFMTFYLVTNEHPVPVDIRMYFADASGKPIVRTERLAANSRRTISLSDVAGVGAYGAVFQSLTPGFDIYVERSLYWGPQLQVSTLGTATKALSPTWYFAEGSVNSFFGDFFMLFNPTQTAVTVTGDFQLWGGRPAVRKSWTIAPQSRLTMDIQAEIPDVVPTDFSVAFTSTGPIVAERSMFWDRSSPYGWIGGTTAMGATAPAGRWLFAEGNAASDYKTYYLLQNPHDFSVTVLGRYMPEGWAAPVEKTYVLPPQSRTTLQLGEEVGQVSASAEFVSLTSDAGLIAERSVYWGGWIEGTGTVGITTPAREWHLPEGSESGSFDDFILILNPNAFDVDVDVTLYLQDLYPITVPAPHRPHVAAHSRYTIPMAEFLRKLEQSEGLPAGSLALSSYSTRVRAPVDTAIVVEHALYRDFRGFPYWWQAGGAGFGIPVP